MCLLSRFVTSGRSDVHTIFETSSLPRFYPISEIKQPQRRIQSTKGELNIWSIFRRVPKLRKASITSVDFDADVFWRQLLGFTYFIKPNGCTRCQKL